MQRLWAAAWAVIGCAWLASCGNIPVLRFDATSPIERHDSKRSDNSPLAQLLDLPQTDMDHQVDLNQLLAFELQRYASSDPVRWKFDPGNVPTNYVVDTADPILYVGPSDRNLDPLIAAIGANSQSVAIRNDVVASLIAASSGNCSTYVKSLRGDQVGSRLTADTLAGSLATASSLVPHTQAAGLLAGLSALSTSEGASIDRDVFAQQAAEAVGDAILKLRAQDRAIIESRMQLPYNTWPLGLALADVLNFHGDCSVTRGLVQMQGALQQREMAVQAVRTAASQALTSPGSAPSILQVVAALEDSAGSFSAAPTGAESPSIGLNTTPSNWNQDLTNLQSDIVACMTAEATALAKTAQAISTGTSTFVGAGACKTRAQAPAALADWPNLTNNATTILGGSGAPTMPTSGSTTAYTQQATQFVSQSIATFQSQTTPQLNAIATVRSDLALTLSSWPTGGKASDVVSFIRAFAGLPAATPAAAAASTFSPAIATSELSKLDPVIAYEIAAAYTAQSDTNSTGALAAAEALQAGITRYQSAVAAQ